MIMTDKEFTAFINDIVPFVGLGAFGGFIKALNASDKFTWRTVLVRLLTGAFGGLIGGMWLLTTSFPPLLKLAMAGAIGVTANELIVAIQHRLCREIMGEHTPLVTDEDTTERTPLVSDQDTTDETRD